MMWGKGNESLGEERSWVLRKLRCKTVLDRRKLFLPRQVVPLLRILVVIVELLTAIEIADRAPALITD